MHNIFVLGHGGAADEIRRNCLDLASLGLVREFFWVDSNQGLETESVRKIGPELENLQEFGSLTSMLRHLIGPVIIVTLEDLRTGVQGERELSRFEDKTDEWTQAIESRIANGAAQRARLILPARPEDRIRPQAKIGWSTYVVSPEDSDAPNATITPLPEHATTSAVARIAAHALIGLFGLWQDSSSVPALKDDGSLVSTGDGLFRLVRSYYRAIDATQVETTLMDRVADISEQMPITEGTDGRQTVHMTEAPGKLNQAAEALISSFHGDLLTPQQPYVERETIRQQGFAAVKAFLREFFGSLIGTPSSWSASMTHAGHAKFAEFVQNHLYGKDSIVDVESGSYKGRLDSRSIERLSSQSQSAVQSISTEKLRVGGRPALHNMWNAYTKYCLTLVDGIDRQDERLETPRSFDGQSAIVEHGWQVSGDVSDTFHGFHNVLGDSVAMSPEMAEIPPFDPYKASIYEEALDFTANQSADKGVFELRENFRKWRDKYSTSFAWRTGENIRVKIDEAQQHAAGARDQWKSCESQLENYVGRNYEVENRKLRAKLHAIGGTGLLFALIVGYLCVNFYREDWKIQGFKGLDWRWTTLTIFLIVLLTLVLQMQVFARVRRGIYDEIQTKKMLQTNLGLARENLAAAIGDVNRLAGAYQQFLSWSTIIGRVIARPFGKPKSSGISTVLPQGGLPQTTKVGRALIDADQEKQLVIAMRKHIFQRGWAENALDEMWEKAAQELQREHGKEMKTRTELYGEPGLGTRSSLDEMVRHIAAPTFNTDDRIRTRWQDALREQDVRQKLGAALNRVEYYEDGERQQIGRDRFLGSLVQDAQYDSAFSRDAVGNTGLSEDLTKVDHANSKPIDGTSFGSDSGKLSQFVVLGQFGVAGNLNSIALDNVVTSNPTFSVQTFGAETDIDFQEKGSSRFSFDAGFDGLK